MRIIQGPVKYELQMKWTPTYVQHKASNCKTWGIDYSDYNMHLYKLNILEEY